MKNAQRLGINTDNMKPCRIRLHAANGKRLTTVGVAPVMLSLGNKKTEVEMIVCVEVQGFLLSWYHAIELAILPPCFPNQISTISADIKNTKVNAPADVTEKIPSISIRKKHEAILRSTFSSVFDSKQELKIMSGKPMRIELKEDAVPYAVTAARSIPFG